LKLEPDRNGREGANTRLIGTGWLNGLVKDQVPINSPQLHSLGQYEFQPIPPLKPKRMTRADQCAEFAGCQLVGREFRRVGHS